MGKGGKQTIGFKYHLGLHMVLAQQLDAVLALKFQDKTAWEGTVPRGQINMNKPELFGGKKKEGGVSGVVDVLDGKPLQGKNGYLKRVLGSTIPAFRGVASLVFRQCYLGNNPYIKPVSVKATGIHCHFDDWYPEKAEIGVTSKINDVTIYIALDHSNSMTSGRLATQRAAVSGLIDKLRGGRNDVMIIGFNSNVTHSIVRLNCDNSDYDALQNWVETPRGTAFGNEFSVALSMADEYFRMAEPMGHVLENANNFRGVVTSLLKRPDSTRRRVALVVTDGEVYTEPDVVAANAIINGIEGLEVFGFNIDASNTYWTDRIDNTPSDGVPVVSGGDPNALRNALLRAFITFADMNPAHILRDVLIAPSSDGSGDPSEIGDSFTIAANRLYNEGFGLSFFWQNSGSKEEFKKIVEKHIDASCFIDRTTGKWEIKLIRDDYDVDDLIAFGVGGIPVVAWGDVSKPDPRELPNQVTVTFTKRGTGDTGSVTIANVAALQITGRIKTEKVEYEGVTRQGLASRLCMRDLASLTTPLLSGSFTAAYAPPDINLGTPVIIHDPRLGIAPTVVRITEFSEGDGRDNSVMISFVEDRFALGDEDIIAEDVVEVEDTTTALQSEHRMVEEAPYYALVFAAGQSDVDAQLINEPDIGRLIATGNQPNGSHINAQITVDAGSGYLDGETVGFSPAGTLLEGIAGAADDTTATIALVDGLNSVEAGSLARIGSEYVRIDDMALTDDVVTLTLGRGCLDTVPAPHAQGEAVIFWQTGADLDGTEYLASEEIDVKFRPKTGSETLMMSEAPVDEVTFNSRAIRPYPVGQLKVEGEYAPTDILPDTVTLTWAHRDRKFQTTESIEDHTVASIGPETGVSYHAIMRTVEVKADYFEAVDYFAQVDVFTGDDRRVLSEVAVSPSDGTTHDFDVVESDLFDRLDYFEVTNFFDGCFTDRTIGIEFGVRTERDGYENWQTPFVRGQVLLPPSDLSAELI